MRPAGKKKTLKIEKNSQRPLNEKNPERLKSLWKKKVKMGELHFFSFSAIIYANIQPKNLLFGFKAVPFELTIVLPNHTSREKHKRP